MSLKEWPVPSTRTWRARPTTARSSPSVAGQWNSGAAKAMLPAQLVRMAELTLATLWGPRFFPRAPRGSPGAGPRVFLVSGLTH